MSSGSPENKAAFQDEALLADAQANSGLTDFGPDEFRPALAKLTWSLREEAPLNDLGKAVTVEPKHLGHFFDGNAAAAPEAAT